MATRDSTEKDCAVCEEDCTCKDRQCLITENENEPDEKEKICENHCPYCDGTDIDYHVHYSVADAWYHQRGVCLTCNKCFVEILEMVYRSTLITEEKI